MPAVGFEHMHLQWHSYHSHQFHFRDTHQKHKVDTVQMHVEREGSLQVAMIILWRQAGQVFGWSGRRAGVWGGGGQADRQLCPWMNICSWEEKKTYEQTQYNHLHIMSLKMQTYVFPFRGHAGTHSSYFLFFIIMHFFNYLHRQFFIFIMQFYLWLEVNSMLVKLTKWTFTQSSYLHRLL